MPSADEYVSGYRSRTQGNYAWEDWLANRQREAELAPWRHRLDRAQAEDSYYDYKRDRARADEAYNRSHSGYYAMDFDPLNPHGVTYRGPDGRRVEINDRTKNDWDYGTWDADPFRDFVNKERRIRDISIGGNQALSARDGHVQFGNLGGLFGRNMGDSSLADYEIGGAPAWSYTAPAGWGGYQFDVTAIDPKKAMEAQVPWFKEQLGDALAQVTSDTAPAMRGFVGDTGYQARMSNEGRRWNEDFQRVAQEMALQAEMANARNQLERQMAEQDASLQAWATQGGWGHEAELARNSYGADTWGTQQELELRRRMGLDDYNLSRYNIEGNSIADIIGSLGQFLG